MAEPHHQRTAGYSMIVVAASLALIGILYLVMGEDVLFADKIQRSKTLEFETCLENNDFSSPQCQKYQEFSIYERCVAEKDLESDECYIYRTWVDSAIFEECRANRDDTSPQCQKYGDKIFSGILEK